MQKKEVNVVQSTRASNKNDELFPYLSIEVQVLWILRDYEIAVYFHLLVHISIRVQLFDTLVRHMLAAFEHRDYPYSLSWISSPLGQLLVTLKTYMGFLLLVQICISNFEDTVQVFVLNSSVQN